jgi:hypothetical protein
MNISNSRLKTIHLCPPNSKYIKFLASHAYFKDVQILKKRLETVEKERSRLLPQKARVRGIPTCLLGSHRNLPSTKSWDV